MRHPFLFPLIICSLIFNIQLLNGKVQATPSHPKKIKSPLKGYRLVWSDEFDTPFIDNTKWTYQEAKAGWVNHELQTYVTGKSPKGQKVAECSGGTLKIHCFQEGDKIYSGRLYGNRNEGFRYGYIEARIKLPKGKGTWPAWWMMPVNGGRWPACGEIDIMEEVGVDADMVSSSIHCQAYNHPQQNTEDSRDDLRRSRRRIPRICPGMDSKPHPHLCGRKGAALLSQ